MTLGFYRPGVAASKVARLAGASMVALICSTPALADCSPDPAPPFGTVTCTGNDADGYVANSNGATVNVQQGASVSGITAGASATPVTISINNNGAIQASSNESILGANSALFGVTSLTNSATGSIGAIRAIVGSLNNYGVIDGGALSALSMEISASTAIFPSNFFNPGTIASNSNSNSTIRYVNSIVGSSYNFSNDGNIINQGSGSAILAAPFNGSMHLYNSSNGVIRSNGTAITLQSRGEILNEGLIQGGTDAIVLASSAAPGGQFIIGNRGTINGSIRAIESGGAIVPISINNSFGVINGSVLLGSGNDFVSTQLGNISGTMDGGAGTDTFQVDFLQDALLSNPFVLPTNFEILNVGLGNGVALTFGTGFALNGTLNLARPQFAGGTATLINRTNLVSNGTAINNPLAGPALTFLNEGSITTTHSNLTEAAVRLENTVGFENSGSINATGGSGVNLIGVVGGTAGIARNSGTITADGTGLAASRVNLNNSGTITSNQGIGVVLTSSSGSSSSGQISGAVAGVSLTQSTLVNTGTISSPVVGAQLGAAGVLDNRTAGVVTGGTFAVQGLTGTANKIVRNAGTINGNVDLGGTTGNSNNTYVAFAGGVLNGNLNLGSGGDRFVTLLPVNGINAFAGVTGTITGGGRETIVYMVDSNASWVLGSMPAPFSAESFDLASGSVLTLTGAAPQAHNTSFSGAGTVNLNADLTNNTFGPILTVGATTPRFQSNTVDGVRVVSSGTLTTSRTVAGSTAQPAVRVLGTTSSAFGISTFNNTGTINVNDLATGPGSLAGIAIVGNGRATNRGTINLNGGVGVFGSLVVASTDPITGQQIYNTGRLTNDGSIVQVAGGATARGVENIGTVINTGSINTAGVAVNLAHTGNFGGLLDNIGTITSTGSNAVRVTATGTFLNSLNPVTVINGATGVITGGPGFDAIFLNSFASVDNSGTINGNVKLGASSTGATYINRGGTLNGNLTFDSGDDVFISIGATNGVTGIIEAGAGFDTYAAGYTASITVPADNGGPLLSNFERWGIGAIGTNTVVTVTGPAAGLNGGYYFFGDGTVVNQANVNMGATAGANIIELAALTGSAGGLSFVNEANIYDGIFGSVASFENRGIVGLPTLSGQSIINLSAKGTDTFRFTNSGTIAPFFSPTNAPSGVGYLNVGMLPGQSVFTTASITNSGIINARSSFSLNARDVTFLNSGTINAIDPNGNFFGNGVSLEIGDLSSSVANSRFLADRVVFQNTGAINGFASVHALSRATVFNNSGSISGEPIFSSAADIYVAPTLTSFITPPGATQPVAQFADQESLQFLNSGSIGGTVSIQGSVQAIGLVNSGTINVAAPIPSMFFSTPELALTAAITTVGSQAISLNNSGSIMNSAIGGSAVGVGGAAGFDGNSPANATVTIDVTNSGSIRANGGAIISPANPNSPGSQSEVEVNTALAALALSTGQSTITINNALNGVIETTGIAHVSNDPASAAAGYAAGDGSVAIIGSANRINFVNAGTVSGGAGVTFGSDVSMGLHPEFDDIFDQNDDFEPIVDNSYLPGAVLFFNSIDTVSNTGTINGSVDLGAFDDIMVNYGAVNGDVFLRSGNDAFTQGLAGTLVGAVDGGGGTDALTIDTTTGTGAAFDMTRFVNFESLLVNGSGSVGLSGALAYDTINLSGAGIVVAAGQSLSTTGPATITGTAGNERLTNGGAIASSVLLGAGDDIVSNSGTIGGTLDLGEGNNLLTNGTTGILSNAVMFGAGNDGLDNSGRIDLAVNLGDGDDMFVLRSGSTSAAVSGGAGTDQVTLILTGTETAPDQLDFSAFTAFEALRHESGVGLLSGSANFGLIDIIAGRFIGAADSTINSTNIVVASGATFGSAGTVNGDILVNGTLSPGASPGTMTVNGNVGLNSGSNTLFELTPTVTDQLVINGSLIIAPNATLTLTGTRPITPGVPLNLITASGGITGSFATINKASSIVGFTRIFNGSLQLLGLFPVEPAFSPQIGLTIDYVNNVLQNPQISGALLSALPGLVTPTGATDTAAFAQLNPEAFASVAQVGVETGLALAKAFRVGEFAMPDGQPGFFTYGQGFGNWRQLSANADRGTNRADIKSYGMLGGMGFGSSSGSLSLFVGYVDAKQDINTIGTTTKASGIVAGAAGHVSNGPFRASAMFAYDGATAKTARVLFNGKTAQSNYNLSGFTIDLNAGYTVAFSDNWSVEPRVGLTHISIERGTVSETGGTPFDLDVIERTTKATFIDGELLLSGGQSDDATFKPWISAGVRHQLKGNAVTATGGFVGLPTDLTVAGADRGKTLPILGAGLNFAIGKNTTLFADYQGEFGKGTEGQNVNVGVRVKF